MLRTDSGKFLCFPWFAGGFDKGRDLRAPAAFLFRPELQGHAAAPFDGQIEIIKK